MNYAGINKDKEIKLSFDENLSQEDKDLIGKEVIELGEEEKNGSTNWWNI